MGDFGQVEPFPVKNLYQAITGKRTWDARWSEYKDPGEENAALQPYRASFPVVHKWTCPNVRSGEWVTAAIEVNDPLLRELLHDLFRDVPKVDLDDDVLSFKPPFQPFLFKWEAFKTMIEEEQNAHSKSLLQYLHDMISSQVDPVLAKIKRAKVTQSIDWDLLVDSCVPGELVLGSLRERPMVYKITDAVQEYTPSGIPYLKVTVDYYDWDGRIGGIRSVNLHVNSFAGEVALKTLALVPFQFLKNPEDIKSQHIARGKLFESLCGYSFRHYRGIKLTGRLQGQVSRRVIIDAFAYHTFHDQNWLRSTGSIHQEEELVIIRPNHRSRDSSRTRPKYRSRDSSRSRSNSRRRDSSRHRPTHRRRESSSRSSATREDAQDNTNVRNEFRVPFTQEQHLLSVPTVKGFDLENRQWCEFYIDGFSDIVWNESAFDKLVIDSGEKKMILAFSEQVRDSRERSDDFIKNKGRGVLMLLCGPPGVGKTLTAESIAERAHLPLYAINAGDIGSAASGADEMLKVILECCRLWNAVILLDEADVFLEARGIDSLARNELVSVFLRRLEYFGGLMFLTTNRPRSLDTAFESRLDLIIPYPDLDANARQVVWKTFITTDPISAATFKEPDYEVLSQYKCNGREIKNIVKIARMLAVQDKTNLSMEHISMVVKLKTRASKMLGKDGYY